MNIIQKQRMIRALKEAQLYDKFYHNLHCIYLKAQKDIEIESEKSIFDDMRVGTMIEGILSKEESILFYNHFL